MNFSQNKYVVIVLENYYYLVRSENLWIQQSNNFAKMNGHNGLFSLTGLKLLETFFSEILP